MDINKLTIGEAKELAAMFGGNASNKIVDHGLQIVVLDRGFAYVGDVTTDGEWCYIDGAKNIRRWGTTKGLGELAADGPRPESKIDESGKVKAPIKSVISFIECDKESWKK